MQGEDNKERGGRGQGAAAGHGKIMMQDAVVIWAMVGRVKKGFINSGWLIKTREIIIW